MTSNDSANGLTHVDNAGAARMVDVSAKPSTVRTAVAEGVVRMNAELADAIEHDALAKGDVLQTARLAGIQGAKQTAQLIPLCHPLPIDAARVDVTLDKPAGLVRITAEVRTTARTGVEMEALAAVSIAALTVVDMGKSIDRGMVVESVRLLSKTGGQRGDYRAPDALDAPDTKAPSDG
ncbi:MAG: cyclic pyranopterin monophosphate synthase MoaC [Planctomycetota bacterium]